MKTVAISAIVVLTGLLQLSTIEACSCMSMYSVCPPYLSYISVVNVTFEGPDIDEAIEMDPWNYQYLGQYIYQAEVHNIYDEFGGDVNVPFATKLYSTYASGSLCGSSLVVGQDYLMSEWDISKSNSRFGICSVTISVPNEHVAVTWKNTIYSTCGDQEEWLLKKRKIPDTARSASNVQVKDQQKSDVFKKWLLGKK
ncbi:hypothetical protein ACF0H5_020977 [Mactra antiquata]